MNMDENQREDVLGAPATLSPTRTTATDRKSKRLKSIEVIKGEKFADLLRAMKQDSGLSNRAIAERMGLKNKEGISQYLWSKRGSGGTSQIQWFLRYAEATGHTVWLTSPSLKAQIQLRAQYTKPPGNPEWIAKKKRRLGVE
jgi:hypothetical protein